MLETDKVIKAPSNVKDGDMVNGKIISLAVDKQYRTVLTTLTLLLKSTRFQAVLGYTIAGVVINLIPELAPAKNFINQASILVVAFVVGKSVEDAVGVWKANENLPPTGIETQIPEIAKMLWDEFQKNLLAGDNATPPAETPVEPPENPPS